MNGNSEVLVSSISGTAPETTEALWLGVFLAEIKRQAELGSRYVKRAWTRAMSGEVKSNDNIVWGDLQAALFSAIVIQRILKPGPVRGTPKETHAERKRQAEHRGNRLRELLSIEENSPLFFSKDVRDACEHFDEKMDAVVLDGTASIIDWHISLDGRIPQSLPHDTPGQPRATDLRAFFPRGGVLRFSAKYQLDLFALDIAFLRLLEEDLPAGEAALQELKSGPMTYGAAQYVRFMPEQTEDARIEHWLLLREKAGMPVPSALVARPRDYPPRPV
ncbi:hypothetical protein ACFRJ9_15475 [Paenarthrobacter sp. NPDC056912]|uniref:hypothetical protein n=1 Tax=Paenarthrobacter sp. NPDC056912 TaxID=3345965 RepID=UPI0036724356